MQTPYELLGGEAGVRQLADVFYDVMDEMPQAESIRKMHQASLTDVKQKLFEYLSGWMGGQPHYETKYGTVCLTKPHQPFRIGPAERDQWLQCMDEALRRVNASDEVKDMLKIPMYMLADTVRNNDGNTCSTDNLIATDAGCAH
ncbi:MAG: globin [Verrucomicrobiaceae bacterium]|nr:globin [Verrucomicrobiaceae bacterium]